MAITTIAGLDTAVAAGKRYVLGKSFSAGGAAFILSAWAATGQPIAGAANPGNTSGGLLCTNATAGAVPLDNLAASGIGHIVKALTMPSTVTATTVPSVMVLDRIWHAGKFTCTSLGTTTLSSQPSIAGRLPGTDYALASIFLEMVDAAASSATTVSVTYTNDGGTGGQTATLDASIASYTANRVSEFRLAAGDRGVQSVDSVTVGGATNSTGTFNIVIARMLSLSSGQRLTLAPPTDALLYGLPTVYQTSCLWLAGVGLSSTVPLHGRLEIIQG